MEIEGSAFSPITWEFQEMHNPLQDIQEACKVLFEYSKSNWVLTFEMLLFISVRDKE